MDVTNRSCIRLYNSIDVRIVQAFIDVKIAVKSSLNMMIQAVVARYTVRIDVQLQIGE